MTERSEEMVGVLRAIQDELIQLRKQLIEIKPGNQFQAFVWEDVARRLSGLLAARKARLVPTAAEISTGGGAKFIYVRTVLELELVETGERALMGSMWGDSTVQVGSLAAATGAVRHILTLGLAIPDADPLTQQAAAPDAESPGSVPGDDSRSRAWKALLAAADGNRTAAEDAWGDAGLEDPSRCTKGNVRAACERVRAALGAPDPEPF